MICLVGFYDIPMGLLSDLYGITMGCQLTVN